ncbi:MAG: hypothetical protein ACI9CF_001617 [Candidatus Omnitrophota bacterium]|jgi:hypothetical protein
MKTKTMTISLILGLILIAQTSTVRGDTAILMNYSLPVVSSDLFRVEPMLDLTTFESAYDGKSELNWIPLIKPMLDSELYLLLQGAESLAHSA